ncbi:MAG: heavy-metal-associated domain-containing protein, partial [Chitinophagaceae bacterium]
MKNYIFLLAFIMTSFFSRAQVRGASLQASGLTCAMCAKSVYKNLEALPFMDSIHTDLETSTFQLRFKEGMEMDADQIRKKVEDAGFSVASLRINVSFTDQPVKNDQHITVNGKVYHFLNIKDQSLSGDKSLLLIDKTFLSPKEFKKYASSTKMACF